MKRLVIGMTGASGAIYGVRILEVLKGQAETHLIMTEQAKKTLLLETDVTIKSVESLASFVHTNEDLTDPLSSGSFMTAGMVIIPCSMKTLSAVANSYSQNLIGRAADVALKERRRLILVARETPLHLGHLKLMTMVTEMGAIVLPPMPGFYHRPETVSQLIDHTVGKVLDLFEIPHNLFRRWQE